MQKVVIVDYGMGNLHSVEKAVNYSAGRDFKVIVSGNAEDIKTADRIILPGQGAIAGCMAHINEQGLYQPILEAAKTKPFMAICVGPQLLMDYSEENGGTKGFSIFKGTSKKFSDDMLKQNPPLKIPHMGWNRVNQTKKHGLWKDIADLERFYFIHSYYLEPLDKDIIVGTTDYGHIFATALAVDNIFTTQCHPENSSKAGLQLFNNFLNWKV